MTIEEAIAYFEERRNYNPHNGNPAAERLAIEALRAQQEHFREVTKKVGTLTLDELRQMDGEPVWVQFLHNKIGYWDLIRWHNSEFIRSYRSVFLLIDEYGKTWLAYRHKPEEDDHDERKENENE